MHISQFIIIIHSPTTLGAPRPEHSGDLNSSQA